MSRSSAPDKFESTFSTQVCRKKIQNNPAYSKKDEDGNLGHGGRDERRHRSRSSSSEDSSHAHSHRHKFSDKRDRSNRNSSRDRRRRHSSSERRSESHKRRSRSHKRERHSSHRSSRHRHRSRSPPQRSRSSREKSRSWSPAPAHDRAMHAQERLAKRLERAKDLMKRKEEFAKKEKEHQSQRIEGLSYSGKIEEAIKRATDMVNDSTVNTSFEGMSAKATAQIEALRAKAFAETGIQIPSYYNPLAINPMNYAQQAAKRKKLWAKKSEAEVEKEKPDQGNSEKVSVWSGVKFGDDKSNEKFAKLMGIKSVQGQTSKESHEIIKKQAEVFQNLDMQYQQARLATHTQRGLGLGFSSTMIDPNVLPQSSAPPSTR